MPPVAVAICAILTVVFLGLAALLAIVLRGTGAAQDRKVVMHALRDLVVGTLVAVAQLPGKLAAALVDAVLPRQGNQLPIEPPPTEPAALQELPPAQGGEQNPSAEPRA